MTFYISESLKGTIEENDLINQSDEKKVNLDSLYADIRIDKDHIYFNVNKLKFKKNKIIVNLDVPFETNLLKVVAKPFVWDSFSLKIRDLNNSENDNVIFKIKSENISLKKIQKSLSGYNYNITIIIDKE